MTSQMTSEQMQQKLWDAAERGDCGTIRLLAMAGVDIEARNEDGFTAFNLATAKGHSDAAMTLIAAKEMQYARSIGEDPAVFYKVGEGRAKKRA